MAILTTECKPRKVTSSSHSDDLARGAALKHNDGGLSWLAPRRRFDPQFPELMDRPGIDVGLLRQELRTLEQLNRRGGGHWLMLRYLNEFAAQHQPTNLRVLDLGTGSADVPRALVAWARQRQLPIKVTAIDWNSEVLRFAEELNYSHPEIQLENHDLRALPYAPGSFDLVLCSLTLHHFTAPDAVAILRQIRSLSRKGYLVIDLCRTWLTIGTTALFVRILSRSPVFRHDALYSSRAAFTLPELRNLAGQAGINRFQIKTHPLFCRMVLAGKNEELTPESN
jgi:SAM-dependent methyltransferase